MKRYINLWMAALCAMFLGACSTDTELTPLHPVTTIRVGAFPAFDEGMQTRAVGTFDAGKTAWANGDQIMVKITDPANGDALVGTNTLTYDGITWNWSEEQIKTRLATVTATAYYAPAYEWSTATPGTLTLKSGKQAGTDEYLVYTSNNVTLASGINIDFSNTRTYSRLRVAAETAGKTVTLTCGEFTTSDGTTTASTAITTTTDSKGNAYFYGKWAANAQLDMKADWYEFTKTTAAVSEAGKSYAINGIKPVKVCEYYFADGSWGTQAERTGQTPVAVIYYAGDPTNDDAALKRDHPGCTHGLAVALNEDGIGTWQTNYETYGKTVGEWIETNTNSQYVSTLISDPTVISGNLNKILGYNHTKAMEAFNAATENSSWKVDIIDKVITYRTSNTAPPASSGWYIPSPKEWHLIYTGDYNKDANGAGIKNDNLIAINSALTAISATTFPTNTAVNNYLYWSSSENSQVYAYYMNIFNGSVNYTNKNISEKIRYTLSF